MPVEERALIFERFARGVTAGRRSGSEGAGLGLALVDEHVRMHGGGCGSRTASTASPAPGS